MKKRSFFVSLVCLVLAVFLCGGSAAAVAKAEEARTSYNAKAALLMDGNTGTVLFEQNKNTRLQIASMVKIMTLLVIYDELNQGNITVDTDIVASSNASSMGGSQAFLDANNSYKADELIKSIIVASANDSCVAMAEHIAGDTGNFVAKMNNRTKELGLEDTYFVNCTGLPAPNQYSSAYDVAVMTRELIKNPMFFEHAKIWMFDFSHPSGRVTGLTNTNKLVRFYEGCDGGKTGFTSEALSCLSATAKRGNTRLISVVIGSPSSKIRNGEVSKMFNYGFANFETKQLVFKDGDIIENIPVANGKQKTITARPKEDFFMLVKKGENPEYTVNTEIANVKAPIAEKETIGKIVVRTGGEVIAEVPLVSECAVGKATYFDVIDRFIDEWNG